MGETTTYPVYRIVARPLPHGWVGEVIGCNPAGNLDVLGLEVSGVNSDELISSARHQIAELLGVPTPGSFGLTVTVLGTIAADDRMDDGAESYCYLHGWERVTPFTYRVCRECCHVYDSPGELLGAQHAEANLINAGVLERAGMPVSERHISTMVGLATPERLAEWGLVSYAHRVEDVTFCPLCSHDW